MCRFSYSSGSVAEWFGGARTIVSISQGLRGVAGMRSKVCRGDLCDATTIFRQMIAEGILGDIGIGTKICQCIKKILQIKYKKISKKIMKGYLNCQINVKLNV